MAAAKLAATAPEFERSSSGSRLVNGATPRRAGRAHQAKTANGINELMSVPTPPNMATSSPVIQKKTQPTMSTMIGQFAE
jgi:hypothetical protein